MPNSLAGPEDHRVAFDFEIAFSNGGGISGWDFRLDIDGTDISDEALGDYIVKDLRLLMVGSVVIRNKRVFKERHKRAGGKPTENAPVQAGPVLIDLSADAQTVVHLPATPPPLAALADVDAVVVRLTGMAGDAVTRQALLPALEDFRGKAVLIETGKGAGLTPDAAAFLRDGGAALVGLDGPAGGGHSLGDSGIPVVEHLSGLDALPLTGLRVSAVPARMEAGASVPVRAWTRPSGQ